MSAVRVDTDERHAGDGRAELEALAHYAMVPVAGILATKDIATWATARLIDGLGNLAHGFATPLSQLVRTAVQQQTELSAIAWPDLATRYREDDAGFLMGIYGFSENYCDTGLGSVAHPGSIVIPTLLIAAQQRPISGGEALAAIAVGYNVSEYLGAILNGGLPRMAHQIRGFRPTPSVGPVAAVAILARLSGASEGECLQAMALACQQGGGLRAGPYQSPLAATRIQSGEAIRRAIHTLRLARAGVLSDPGILRSDGGYFCAYAGGELGHMPLPEAGALRDPLMTVSMKLDCTPHTLVTMLDTARALARRPDFHMSDIKSIVVAVPEQHNAITGGSTTVPTTFPVAARHVPFCIALALETKSYLYPDLIVAGMKNQTVCDLIGRITLVPDQELTTIFNTDPTSWPARVEIEWNSGRRDVLQKHAPETSDWTAEDALREATEKVVTIMGKNHVGSADALSTFFAKVAAWPDIWAEVRRSPLCHNISDKLAG